MKILLVSASNPQFDGRLRALIRISQKLGESISIYKGTRANASDIEFCVDGQVSYISFVKFVIKTCKNLSGVDIIIADNRKAIIPCIFAKKITNCKFMIRDMRELYYLRDFHGISGMFGYIIEKLFSYKFDLTICANNERAIKAKELFHLKSIPIVFENIRKLEYTKDNSIKCPEVGERFKSYKWKLVSTAGCDIKRGINKYIDTIGKMEECCLVLIGDKESKSYIKTRKYIDMNKYDNIFILPRLNQDELKMVINQCDIGVVCYGTYNVNNRLCASGKIYEFAFEGIPVLCSGNPPLKSICKKYKIGVATEDVKNGIKKIISNYDKYKSNASKIHEKINEENIEEQVANVLLSQYNEIGEVKC